MRTSRSVATKWLLADGRGRRRSGHRLDDGRHHRPGHPSRQPRRLVGCRPRRGQRRSGEWRRSGVRRAALVRPLRRAGGRAARAGGRHVARSRRGRRRATRPERSGTTVCPRAHPRAGRPARTARGDRPQGAGSGRHTCGGRRCHARRRYSTSAGHCGCVTSSDGRDDHDRPLGRCCSRRGGHRGRGPTVRRRGTRGLPQRGDLRAQGHRARRNGSATPDRRSRRACRRDDDSALGPVATRAGVSRWSDSSPFVIDATSGVPVSPRPVPRCRTPSSWWSCVCTPA